MAKRRKTATKIIRVGASPRQAAPIVNVRVPRSAPAKRRGRRRGGGGAVRRVGGIIAQHNLDVGIGGALYGFAVKSGWIDKLPAIPIVGRTGTAAILLDYFSKRGGGPMVGRMAIAAAALAGYQLGSTGSITGDDDDASPDGYDVSGGIQTMGDEDD